MASADITVSMAEKPGDIAEFQRIMRLLSGIVRPKLAVVQGAAYVATALKAASKVSPEKRKVRPMRVRLDSGKLGDAYKGSWEVNNRGKWERLHGFWDTKAEAERQPMVMIENRGLSRLLWWKMSAIILNGQGVHGDRESFTMKRNVSTEGAAARNARFSLEDSTRGAALTMHNSLKYAALAFKTSGRATVNNAMRRAANNMRKFVEREVGGKIKEGNK